MTEFTSTTVDDSGDVHGQVTLAIGSAGAPVIAYTSQSGEVRLAEQDDQGEWIITRPPCGTALRDEYRISLDIDSESKPHIALVNGSTDLLVRDHLFYGVRGQQWVFEEVPTDAGLFPRRVRFPSMKLYKGFAEQRENGHTPFEDAPHISYQAAQGRTELRHAAKLRPRDNPAAPPVWRKHVDTIDGAESGWFSVLNIGTDDTIRIAHFTESGGDKRLNVTLMRNEQEPDRPFAAGADGWHKETLDGGAGRGITGEFPSLAQTISDLGTTGGGAVSYMNRSTMNPSTPQSLNLSIFGNEPGLPVVEVVTRNVESGGSRSSVAWNFRGRWCVVYGSDGRLQFATRTGPGAFTIEDVEAGGGWPSMVFNHDGNAQIAHVAGGTLRFVVAVPDE